MICLVHAPDDRDFDNFCEKFATHVPVGKHVIMQAQDADEAVELLDQFDFTFASITNLKGGTVIAKAITEMKNPPDVVNIHTWDVESLKRLRVLVKGPEIWQYLMDNRLFYEHINTLAEKQNVPSA